MSDAQNKIKFFESRQIRSEWDAGAEKWWFSIVDVVATLTDSVDATAYWRKLKQRLKAEGNETVTNCHDLKMRATDGKSRLTDVADTEQLLRLIQSIPSKKAEPFKRWLAQVGSERLDQLQDPELSIEQAMRDYKRLGYSDNWINQRLKRRGKARRRCGERSTLETGGRNRQAGCQQANCETVVALCKR